MPLLLRFIKTVSGALTVVSVIDIAFELLDSVSLAQMYQNSPVLFYYMLALPFIIWMMLFIISIIIKNLRESIDYQQALRHINSTFKRIEEYFEVSPNAKYIDILLFCYEIKDGKEEIVSSRVRVGCIVHVRDDYLHIICLEEEWAVPLHNFVKIEQINKKIPMPIYIPIYTRKKETPFNKCEYKQYKMTNNIIRIFLKTYYDFIIMHNGNGYKLSVPPYELDVLSSLTGLGHCE